MTNRRDPAAPHDFVPCDEIDLLFGAANPTPVHPECPSAETMAALVRRERAMDDPAYVHLTECSPCYQAFRRLQDDLLARATPERHPAVWWAAAALLAVILAGAWWWRNGDDRVNVPEPQTPIVAETHVELDLRPYAIARNTDSPVRNVPPLTLPAARLDLAMLLPTGAEPSSYDVRLVGEGSRVVASTSGQADIRDFVTTLAATLDLRAVPQGDYRLDVRRQGEDWRSFPAIVR